MNIPVCEKCRYRHSAKECPTTFLPARADSTQDERSAVSPAGLHPATQRLVSEFANAMAMKLRKAEQKYGYSDGWLSTDWLDECRVHLREHLEKGDPVDVANYCAFLWHHGASTTDSASLASNLQAGEPVYFYRQKAGGRWIEDTSIESIKDHPAFETRTLYTVPQAQQEAGKDAQDAARYRWLRSPERGMSNLATVISDDFQPPYFELKCGEELDAVIDDAMQASPAQADETQVDPVTAMVRDEFIRQADAQQSKGKSK